MIRPMPDDRRDPNGELLRDLYNEVSNLAERVNRMADRLEDVAVLSERVENNRQEIERLRETTDSAGGVLDRLATVERAPVTDQSTNDTGGLFVSTGTIIAFLLFFLGALGTAFWRIIDWLRDVSP